MRHSRFSSEIGRNRRADHRDVFPPLDVRAKQYERRSVDKKCLTQTVLPKGFASVLQVRAPCRIARALGQTMRRSAEIVPCEAPLAYSSSQRKKRLWIGFRHNALMRSGTICDPR